MTNFLGFVGTYTKGNSEGIYSFTLDTEAERLININVAAKIENPTYLAVDNDNRNLYSVIKEGDNGGVAAFTIQQDNGRLTILNQQTDYGASPCHVSLDKTNQNLLSSNYHRGTVSAYKLDASVKTVLPNPSTVRHPNIDGRPPHTHYAAFTPDNKYVVAVDLGIDQLITYTLKNDQLVKKNQLNLKKECGPRHMAFHPNANFAYIMTEFSSEVIILRYDTENGSFTEIQAISTLPKNFTDHNQGSAIHISSDGRFLYAGNRGHNSIAIFRIDQETFQLEFIEHVPTEGNWPRDFSLDPTERFVVASNQESNNLILYKRNPETGKLALLQSDVVVPYPVCVKFLNY